MEGTFRSRQEDSSGDLSEIHNSRRILRSSTDSEAAPSSQSSHIELGVDSTSSGRFPEYSPGLNAWSFCLPPPELRGLAASATSNNSEPSWRTGSPQHLSPIQREILADFPWLSEELEQRSLNAGTGTPSSSEASYPRFCSRSNEYGLTGGSQDHESNVSSSVSPLETSVATPIDHVAWAQSMLELQATFEDSLHDESHFQEKKPKSSGSQFSDHVNVEHQSRSVTPAHSETPFNSESLSSSLSDGEAELKKGEGKDDSSICEDAAGTSALSSKRKRPDRKDGKDDKSEDQETKKPTNRPRKKLGVKRVREPRYAIKTRTDTDVMDDGYKWRKYGQKAVKKSPHPRNYYRCTTLNCPVRKRVERCFDDPGVMVTTYEGTHTHQSPTFLRSPVGYPGGLQELLSTLSHHYSQAGNPALPRFPNQSHLDLSSSDRLYSSVTSPLWGLSQQDDGSIQDNLNLLRAQELLRLQREPGWASSIKSEPFQFGAQDHIHNMKRPQEVRSIKLPSSSFSNGSSLSNQSNETGARLTQRQFESLGSAVPEHLGSLPKDYSSFNSDVGPSSEQQPFPPISVKSFLDRPLVSELFSAAPSQESTGTTDGGLLEDMLRPTNPTNLGMSRS